jgi:hypothetical protein
MKKVKNDDNIIRLKSSVWDHTLRWTLYDNLPKDKGESFDEIIWRSKDGEFVYLPKIFWHEFKNLIIDVDGIDFYKDYHKIPFVPKYKKVNSIPDIVNPPREEQIGFISNILEHGNTKPSLRMQLTAAPGFGKTYTSLFLISKWKLKTLIIVHTNELYSQWVDSIWDHLGLEYTEVGQIKGSDLTKNQKHFEKDVMIVNISSLLAQLKKNGIEKMYEIYKDVGLIFADESHKSSLAKKFSQTFLMFETFNIIGISATPERKGIHKVVSNMLFGDNSVVSNHINLIPKVFTVLVDNGRDFAEEVQNNVLKTGLDKVMQTAIYNSLLFETVDTHYFTIINMLIQMENNMNRKGIDENSGNKYIMILPNNSAIQKMHDLLESCTQTKGMSVVFTAEKRDGFVKDFKQENRKSYKEKHGKKYIDHLHKDGVEMFKSRIKKHLITISNEQLVTEGYDDSRLNIMFNMSGRISFNSTIQSSGRVCRKDEKPEVKVFHVFDSNFSSIYPHAVKSLKTTYKGYYKEHGGIEIKNLVFDSNTCIGDKLRVKQEIDVPDIEENPPVVKTTNPRKR